VVAGVKGNWHRLILDSRVVDVRMVYMERLD
jgi:hypothetical protein